MPFPRINFRALPLATRPETAEHNERRYRAETERGFTAVDAALGQLDRLFNGTKTDPQGGLMRWTGNWVPGKTYRANDVVLDQTWLMIANTTTTDRPGIFAVGDPFYDQADVPLWNVPTHSGFVRSGVSYATGDDVLKVEAFQIWVPDISVGVEYEVRTAYYPTSDPDSIVTTTQDVSFSAAGEWLTVAADSLFIPPNTTLVAVIEALNKASETITTHPWVRATNSNSIATDPGTGSWGTRNNPTELRINYTDDGSADRTALLQSVIAGSNIKIISQTDSAVYAEWEILAAGLDQGTHISFGAVAFVGTGPSGEPIVGETCDVQITIPVPAPTQYVEVAGSLPSPLPAGVTATGLLELSGVPQAADANSYGVRVLWQEVSASEDYDLMSAYGSVATTSPAVSGLLASEEGGIMASNLDAFGRVRVSDPLTLFDSQQEYNSGPLFWGEALTGTGSVTHSTDGSLSTLAVNAGGDSVIRQTKQYMRYKPGKSQLVKITGVFGATPSTDLIRRCGYFDGDDGVFLQQDSTGVSFVLRSSTSGSPVDTKVAQASWSEDTASWLDVSKAFLMFADFEWLGVGRCRVGFFLDGVPVTTHIFNAVPTLTTPYMKRANLPVRYEISSAATETGSMKQICSAVISEGGFEEDAGVPFATDNVSAGGASTSTTEVPLLAIRPKLTFNGVTNRGLIQPIGLDLFSTDNAVYRVYYNANVTTGASWASVNAASLCEYDISATAFTTTNAVMIDSGFIAAGSSSKTGAAGTSLAVRLPITLDMAGANPIEVVVTMELFTGNGTGYAGANWREFY